MLAMTFNLVDLLSAFAFEGLPYVDRRLPVYTWGVQCAIEVAYGVVDRSCGNPDKLTTTVFTMYAHS